MQIRSFDLFDTLVVRDVLDPKEIFARVEVAHPKAAGFHALRVRAERESRDPESGETDLAKIHARLGEITGWPDALLSELRATELSAELESIHGVSEAIREVRRAKASGARILLLTDMYLPQETIDAILEKIGLTDVFDEIHLSNECGASKHTGHLYRNLRSLMPIDSDWLHVGDNAFSDVKQAERAGVRVHWRNEALPNKRERSLRRENEDGRVAGLSRVARLSDSDLGAFRAVGANVSGPVFFPYVRWVLETAKMAGIEALYFLSRDGQLLCRMAEAMRMREPSLPECHYLYASRQAWLGAAFDPSDHRHRSHAFLAREGSVSAVFKNLGLSAADFHAPLGALGFDEDEWATPLSRDGRTKLALGLRQGALAESIVLALEKQHILVYDYLLQTGLAQRRRIGLVDIGWKGSMQNMLESILMKGGKESPEVIGFNYGLEVATHPARQRAFRFGPARLPNRLSLYPSVIEMLTPADHGQVTGYRRTSDGTVEPVCEPEPVARPDGIRALHEGAMNFVMGCLDYGLMNVRADSTLASALNDPSAEEISVFREFAFSTFQQAEMNEADRFIPRLATIELLRLCVSPARRTDRWPWPEGALRYRWPKIPVILLRLLRAKMLLCRCLHGWQWGAKKRILRLTGRRHPADLKPSRNPRR